MPGLRDPKPVFPQNDYRHRQALGAGHNFQGSRFAFGSSR